MTSVRLIELTKQYGALTAVDGVELMIASGDLVALLGPSGCGKTTTMRMVAGLLAPSAGDIHFDDRSVLHIPAERRGAVMVFQKHLLFPHLSVGDNVAFGLKMRRTPRAQIARRVAEMLALVQLPGYEARRPHELSGGQQQRVALARALVIQPKLLLLDEPLANLDANLRVEMRQLIRSIQQRLGITTLFVTHDQEEAVMLADCIALLDHGRLLQYDAPRGLYERPLSRTIARFFRNENFLPGVKRAGRIATAWGDFAAPAHNPAADGPVWLTVRPEHVQLDVGAPGPDAICARVRNVVYMGGYTQVQVVIGEVIWEVHAPAATMLQAGDAVNLVLPPAHIWCVPA